jgi:hypothetical protein
MKVRLTCTGVIVLLLAAACGSKGEAKTDTAPGGPLVLGASLSLTGSLAREGTLTKEGYDVCQKVVKHKGGMPAQLTSGCRYGCQLRWRRPGPSRVRRLPLRPCRRPPDR